MSMNCSVRHIGDVTILDLSGRISPGEMLLDRLVIQDLVLDQVNNGRNKILLNLREVSHINSSGIAGLIASLDLIQNRGGELRICSPSKRVSDLFSRTRLDSVLTIHEDEPAALQGFSSHLQKRDLAA